MSEARRLGRNLSLLLEKSPEEKRKDNLKKYFLDPNCIESLQDEIIRLKKELKLMKEYNDELHNELMVACNKIYDTEYKNVSLLFDNQIDKKDEIHEKPKILSLNDCFEKWMEESGNFPLNVKLKKANVFTKFREDNQDFNNQYFSRKAFNFLVKKYAEYKNLTYIDGKIGSVRWFSLNQKNQKKNVIENTKTYLIKNRRNGFYKIGRSKNPLKREQTLQSEEPDIVMVKTWDEDIENKLHIEYKEYRVRGEWFKLSKAQVKYICTKYE